ncbi:alkaline phosphatase D family protein [Pyxidicoccus xibeiensis]|uniref:alkaline phosphatase D family protein n=1 Tax=Pyxidicoccus xibeiensis TaxID=2906759 RepID=UPI0020A7117A|nr:alkaline phosphatase D family protein [Pyxidicoccus xibeiensis]MCP3136336.1 alkaline phosphatase family protein [Pyxidicoccus xibeiensis]
MTTGVPQLERAVAVGRVSPRGARLWMRSPGGGTHRLELWLAAVPSERVTYAVDMGDRAHADHTFAFAFPDDVPGARPLEPVTRYGFRLSRADGVLVGEGRFETLPARPGQMPRRFCIGVASCHQPFDMNGELHELGVRMLRLARTAWERCDVKLVLWAGDQLYADFPENQSLFDPEYFKTVGPPGRESMLECTHDEARAVYHGRYRRNWGHPDWLALQALFPGYPILDDHEVVDNYGSLPEHHTKQWRHVRDAAEAAYRDYQHSRVQAFRPGDEGPYDYSFEYGAAAGYVLDVRSERRSTDGDHARVFAPHQLEHFSTWLNANADAPVLFIMLSVPPFFMPSWLSRVARYVPGSFREDAHDRWMHPQYRTDRCRMLELIKRHQQHHPRQQVVLVCGDVHVGYAARCDWRTQPPTSLHQFVSSSITHKMSSMDWHLARHIPRTHFAMSDLDGDRARIHLLGGSMARVLQQPVGGLNVGTIEVDLDGDRARLNFKLYGEDEDQPDEPKLLFESGFQ